jgi:hypothetical protein
MGRHPYEEGPLSGRAERRSRVLGEVEWRKRQALKAELAAIPRAMDPDERRELERRIRTGKRQQSWVIR